MATKNLLTNAAAVSSVEQVYFSPVAVIPPYYDAPLSSIYCFLAKVDPWDDENDPPQPTQDQRYLKRTFKNMFVAKQITSNNISPVIQRINWETGTIYDFYRDSVDMFRLMVHYIIIFMLRTLMTKSLNVYGIIKQLQL